LNGIFGLGEKRHIAFWQAVKIVDKTEEEDEKGIVTIREKERFSNELTVVYSTGQVAILKQRVGSTLVYFRHLRESRNGFPIVASFRSKR
jgi:hypothetical protein